MMLDELCNPDLREEQPSHLTFVTRCAVDETYATHPKVHVTREPFLRSETLGRAKSGSSSAEWDELRRSPVFESIDEDVVEELLSHCASHLFKPGSTIVEQDRELDALVIICRGLVDLTRIESDREFGVLLLASNDVIFPGAALSKEPSLVSARALTRTRTCSIPIEHVLRAARKAPQLALNMLFVTSGQWRMGVRNILDLNSRTAAQRVGAFLLRLFDLQQDTSAPVLPLPKRNLAARLGMTPETLSRMLQTVARNGLYLRGRTIIIKDREKIEAFCGPDPYLRGDERQLGVFAL